MEHQIAGRRQTNINKQKKKRVHYSCCHSRIKRAALRSLAFLFLSLSSLLTQLSVQPEETPHKHFSAFIFICAAFVYSAAASLVLCFPNGPITFCSHRPCSSLFFFFQLLLLSSHRFILLLIPSETHTQTHTHQHARCYCTPLRLFCATLLLHNLAILH